MRKRVAIIGAGTGGTILANTLSKELRDWQVIVIDPDEQHFYQPGFLFIPFGIYKPADAYKPRKKFLPKKVKYIQSAVDRVDPENNMIYLEDQQEVYYDQLIIASGTRIVPEDTPGMSEGGWMKNIFDFYTFEGSCELAKKLEEFDEGRMVVHITEMPIKCPVAPLEFAFLADDYFTKRGVRENINITYVTPFDGAFTKPNVNAALNHLMDEKSIDLVGEYNVEEIDWENNRMISYDERIVEYDLLVTVPVNMGAQYIQNSGMGDDLDFVEVDKHTMRSEMWDNVWAIGDAGNFPTSKAGSVAHFQAEILLENLLSVIEGEQPKAQFDGHAQCFIEVGNKEAFLIDFNYYNDPQKGDFPVEGVGPFTFLEPTRRNHWGKLMFKWIYWHLLLRGVPLPLPSEYTPTREEMEAR